MNKIHRFSFKTVVLLLILIALYWLYANSPEELHACKVSRVKDGDTFVCLTDNEEELTIRLIGVDTPESVHPDESKNTLEGQEASLFTKSLLTQNRIVYLSYDITRTDKYGRTLAYVYLDEKGEQMLQDILLKEGYADPLTVLPNIKHYVRFAYLSIVRGGNNSN